MVTVDVFEMHVAFGWFFFVFMGGGFLGAGLHGCGVLPMGPVAAVIGFPVLVTVLLQPVLKRRFLVSFDEEGVTVVRPLGQRKVPWSDIAGFCFVLPESETDSWQIRIRLDRVTPEGRRAPCSGPVLAGFGRSRLDHRRLSMHGALFHQFAQHGVGLVDDPRPEDWQRAHVARALSSCV
ncbi:hypothetical protein BIV23_35690 [Streptomyces monashensis]|uniref:Low molecular weight protein antigen 6 PH domain-containing protein n=1 Tax=Streptomyces monashensis TaxID=1678012 RepID=A0A1S2PN07_9ACTN|nr:hypothetical protein BIV23_35690 [Streptomyces monashensis]